MTDANSSLPPAGWYPDPAGSGRSRWWNGFSWSDTFGDAPAPARPVADQAAAQTAAPWARVDDAAQGQAAPRTPAPYSAAPAAPPTPTYASAPAPAPVGTAAPAYTPAPAYAGAPAYGTADLKAPEGTSPYTPFVWVLAVLPVIGLISNLITVFDVDKVVADAVAPGAPVFTGPDIISGGIGWVVILGSIALAIFDWRGLAKAGVPRPFHWAWIFFAFIGAPVYMIGRTVVVRKRVGSGLAPMVVNLALVIVNFVVGMIFAILVFNSMIDSLDQA